MSEFRVRASVGDVTFEAEGPEAAVREMWDDFMDRSMSGDLPRTPSRPERVVPAAPAGQDPHVDEMPAAVAAAKKMPLPAFIGQGDFKGRSNYEQLAVLVFWSKYNRDEGLLKTSEINDLWGTSIKFGDAPGNMSRDLGNARKHGLLEKPEDEGGRYRVTEWGEDQVAEWFAAGG